ncbi:MAG: ATP-binding cassette domain-containing protein, partial [Truepera sp.]|nr:ATP-binding cassette domain-containing protein [Truepera sp.]
MASAAIETRQLSKHYGQRPVVRDLSFRVAPGEVYALVGPNGAGKTTVIRLLTGLAFPTAGSVYLLGL